jgi:hypothetical protein
VADSRSDRRRSALQLVARYGAPALLAAVALFQGYQTERHDLTPWRGGGFGMFSTVDVPTARFFRLYLATDEGEIPAPLPATLAISFREVQTLPTEAGLRRLAGQLAAATWAVPDLPRIELERVTEAPETGLEAGRPWSAGGGFPVVAPLPVPLLAGEELPGGLTRLDTRGVRLELWRYRFDQETTRLEVERLHEARATASPAIRRESDG